MKKANLVLMAAMAAAGLVGVTGGALLPVTAAYAKDKKVEAPKEKLSPDVAKPLVAAQTAMNAKNWDEATTQIQAAQAVASKTPYDSFMIDELGWYVSLQKKDYVGSAAALERVVDTPYIPEADRPKRLRALTQLELQNKQYDKALTFGNRYLATNPGDTEIALGLAQARYLSGDFQGAKTAAEALVASNPKPPEAALLLALRANYEMKNDAGTIKALEGLVQNYPQPKYWEDLLNNQLFRTKDDRALRGLYRLMEDTSTLDKGEEYAEMAAVLVTGGFPNEAKSILERGMSANVMDAAAKSRAQGDLDRARSGAALDAKELASADKQLAAAKTGTQMVGIGKLYFSNGEYQKAADAIQKGLAKGTTDTDDANLLLGIALLRAGKPADAKTAFAAVKAPAMADIARLWQIKIDSTAAAAAPAPAPAATG